MALNILILTAATVWLVFFAYYYERMASLVGTLRYWLFCFVGASLLVAACLVDPEYEPCYMEAQVRDAGVDG